MITLTINGWIVRFRQGCKAHTIELVSVRNAEGISHPIMQESRRWNRLSGRGLAVVLRKIVRNTVTGAHGIRNKGVSERKLE